MSKRDFLTGAQYMHGNKSCFSKKKSNRRFDINLQTIKFEVKPGTVKKIRVCANTIKSLKKSGKIVNKYSKAYKNAHPEANTSK
jgi:ribosomal protein L28